MRAGGYTVHQSLTAEAAAVLKLSLGLARRRGHAQVTPLHVAFTLLSGSSPSAPPPLLTFSASSPAATPSSCAYGLLRRACVKSHTAAAACSQANSHPLQCRALELCFNVALNRLPTTNVAVGGPMSPSSSSSSVSSASSTSFSASLVRPNPTLSNALVAALKRAQANQRRGCIELQSQQPLPPTQQHQSSQQQQPLLALKVELDHLSISILDDPSVSRVMREAGFSSAAVKSSLEEESAMLLGLGNHSSSSSSLAAAVTPQFLLEPYIDFPTHANGGGGGGGSWSAQFLNQPGVSSSCKEEDVRAILEVMVRKQGRRTNPVVVGDSVTVAEASIAELMRRLERDDVPDVLRGAHVIRLHLSYVHVRLMTRADVDARVAELRRSVDAITGAQAAGLVIYVGDMRWAVDKDDDALADISPAEHMVAELASLLDELRAAVRCRAWLVAAASYQTYMRCQQRRRTPPLQASWALEPVVVPAGSGTGLALGPRASPPAPAPRVTMLGQIPLLDLASGDEGGVRVLCAACANNYKKEASLMRAKAEGTTIALAYFPGWPQADEHQTSHHDELIELKRKWSISCERLHLRNGKAQTSNASPIPWCRASLPNHQNKPKSEPKPSSAGLCLSFDTPADHVTSKSNNQDVKTTLCLLLPDSVMTPEEARRHRSESLDGEPAVQESDATISSGDAVGVRRLWLNDLPSSHLKRKAEGGLPLGESKRSRDGSVLDLNLRADEE